MKVRRPPNTPGFLGYLAGFAVSCLVFATLVLVPGLRFYDLGSQLAILTVYRLLIATGAFVLGAPVAFAGCLITQVLCSRISSQPVHVLVIGLAGWVLTGFYLRATGWDDVGPVPVLV